MVEINLTPHDIWVLVSGAVLASLWAIFKVLLSEAVLSKVLLILLKHLAAKTSNSIDNEIIQVIQEALNKPSN